MANWRHHSRLFYFKGVALSLRPVLRPPPTNSKSVPFEGCTQGMTATPELKFLMYREMVPIEVQNQFYDVGIMSVPQFAAFMPNSDELRKSLKEDFGIDTSTGLPA